MATATDVMLGKIFIGGIAPITTRESIKKYFSKYGEIVDSILMQDRLTGKSRGFGFVTFKNPNLIKKVLADTHSIDGKRVECKQALPADQRLDNSQDDQNDQTTKIFVGGIPPTTTESTFKKYFEQFGKIEESFIMVDRTTSKSRGFGFVTFTTVGAVERVINNYDDNFLDGKWVECKKAFPKDLNNLTNSNYSSPSKQKLNTPLKKYSEKLETPSEVPTKSGTPEKRELAIEEKEANETNTSEESHRRESEADSTDISPIKTLDKGIDLETKENLQITLEPRYRDSPYWQDILQTTEVTNKVSRDQTEVDLGHDLKMEGGNDEKGNDSESGADNQHFIDTHYILDQIGDSANRQDSWFKKFADRNQEDCSEEYSRPRRSSILFGIDLIDMNDSEAILQGISMNHFTSQPINRPRYVFFPAAQKNAERCFETGFFFGNNSYGPFENQEMPPFKNLQAIWGRDTQFGL